MTLAADCFRCPGSRCPDFVREGCRRFVDLQAGVGPRTPYADASLERKERPWGMDPLAYHYGGRNWDEDPCKHKWPLTT